MRLFLHALLVLVTTNVFGLIDDPVADYLKRANELGHDRTEVLFYANDRLYRYDIDLNNDGLNEVLISSSLGRQGKMGCVFCAYKSVPGGFERIGIMNLNPDGFYLGPIDEINAYGVTNFFPSGGGEGGTGAYIYDGEKITEKTVGILKRDPLTREVTGPNLFPKYFGEKAKAVLKSLTTIEPDELETKYGIKTDARTYAEAIAEEMANQAKSPPPAPPQAPVNKSPVPPSIDVPTKTLPSTTPIAAPIQQATQPEPVSKLRLLSLLAVISAAVGLIVILLRKKGK